MPSNPRVPLKPVNYQLSQHSSRFKRTLKGKKNSASGLYKINNQKLNLLPQVALALLVVGAISSLTWLYWPTTTESSSSQTTISRSSPTSRTIQPVVIPNTTNGDGTNGQSNLTTSKFTIMARDGLSCDLVATSSMPEAITSSRINTFIEQNLAIPVAWWQAADPAQNNTECFARLPAVFVTRLNPDQYSALQTLLDPATTSAQLIDDADTYAIFFGTPKPDYNGGQYLSSLTKNLKTDKIYFEASKAYAQKRIGDVTYYLDGGCQAPRTNPCSLWRMDIFSGQVSLLKRDVALTAAGQAYEIKDNRSLRFATTQDYEAGVNLLFLDPASNQITLIRLSTKSQSYPITSDYDLTPGEEAYSRYV